MAAQINDDCIELLAEQPLAIRAQAGNEWHNLNLELAIKAMQNAINSLDRDLYTMVLFDPALHKEMRHINELAGSRESLLHGQLGDILTNLSAADQQLLRQWLNNPTNTDATVSEACSRVMRELAQLQNHWAQFMPESMANVAGVLELTIALANLSPSYALI